MVTNSKMQAPHRPPIIVFDGLLESIRAMDNKEEANILLEMIIHFSVAVTQKRSLAHVVIVSNDHTAVEAVKK